MQELGEIETPILLTSTLSVPRMADVVIEYMLALPGNEGVRSINPLVSQTNNGELNDTRSWPISSADVAGTIRSARGGPVTEGAGRHRHRSSVVVAVNSLIQRVP